MGSRAKISEGTFSTVKKSAAKEVVDIQAAEGTQRPTTILPNSTVGFYSVINDSVITPQLRHYKQDVKYFDRDGTVTRLDIVVILTPSTIQRQDLTAQDICHDIEESLR